MAKRLLAIGDIKTLSDMYGEGLYHIHLFHGPGAAVTKGDETAVHEWVEDKFSGARWTSKSLHGQFRFTLSGLGDSVMSEPAQDPTIRGGSTVLDASGEHLTRLLRLLEVGKKSLVIEYYSVGETTLEDVFLTIIGRHQGIEQLEIR